MRENSTPGLSGPDRGDGHGGIEQAVHDVAVGRCEDDPALKLKRVTAPELSVYASCDTKVRTKIRVHVYSATQNVSTDAKFSPFRMSRSPQAVDVVNTTRAWRAALAR